MTRKFPESVRYRYLNLSLRIDGPNILITKVPVLSRLTISITAGHLFASRDADPQPLVTYRCPARARFFYRAVAYRPSSIIRIRFPEAINAITITCTSVDASRRQSRSLPVYGRFTCICTLNSGHIRRRENVRSGKLLDIR